MKKPRTPKEALKLIREAAKKGNFKFADRDIAAGLDPWIEKIMLALGRKRWFISDQSYMSDFRTTETPKQFRKRLDELSATLGVPIQYESKRVGGHYMSDSDSVIAVAKLLRDKEKSGVS